MDCNAIVETILELYENNKWREILSLNAKSQQDFAKLLWVWPSEENLEFLKNNVNKFGLNGIVSIGCGCGLLEWILKQYLELPVVGIEVNKEWWTSKYSMPLFIPHIYTETPPDNSQFSENNALLFCYFNNRAAFNEYVAWYKGNVIIIIGPGKGRGTHTDPTPFEPNFISDNWILDGSQEVKSSKDYIAIYKRLIII